MCKSKFSRLLALVMSFAMVLALAVPANAESDALSAELIVESQGMEFSGKVALSPTEQAALVAVQVLLNGENIGSASLTANEEAVAFESNFLDKVYGIALPTLAENLENSVFAPNSGSAFALDEESYEMIRSALSGDMLDEAAVSGALTMDAEDLNAAMEPLVAMFTQMAQDCQQHMIFQSRETNVTVNGVSIPTTQVSVIADVEALNFVINSMLDSFQSDAQVQAAVATLIDLYADGTEELSGQDYVNVILESMEEIRAEVDAVLSESDFQLTISYCAVNDETAAPVKLALDITMSGETISLALLMNPELNYFLLSANDGYTDYAIEFTIADSAYTLNLLEDGELATRYQLSFDGSAYELAVTEVYVFYDVESESWYEEEYTTSFAGTYALTDNQFTLTLNEVNGMDIGAVVTLVLRNNDSFTIPATFTEITGLTEGEITQVVQDLMTGYQAIESLSAN